MDPIKTFPTKYRAWFAEGGYKSYDTFEEAKAADEPGRGPVERVDAVELSILWLRDADNVAYDDYESTPA